MNGTIPENIGLLLPNLVKLVLDNNELSGSIPQSVSLTKLTKLSLSHNNLYGEIPAGITRLLNLEDLHSMEIHSLDTYQKGSAR